MKKRQPVPIVRDKKAKKNRQHTMVVRWRLV